MDADTHAIRLKCLTDLHYLTKVLGYSDLGAMHKRMCDVVQTVNPYIVEQIKTNNVNPLKYYRDIEAEASGIPFRGWGGSLDFNHPSTQTHKKYEKGLKEPTEEQTTQTSKDWISTNVSHETSEWMGSWLKHDPGVRERLFLMFRGSFKTTIISICHTIQLMLLWPDIRILICSHKKEGGAQEILYAIKRHFMGNPTFRAVWPEYAPVPNSLGVVEWGTSERVVLPNRSAHCAWPEATIEIAGSTTDVTGRHYDYIKNDDLVTRDSVSNDTQIRKTREIKALQRFLFNQPEWGITDNIGTPYHFNDMYSKMRKAKGINSLIIPALTKDNKPTFPERFSYDGLMSIRNDPMMGSYEFSCQYMMNPVPPEDQTFRPEWLERDGFFYDVLPDNLKFYVFVDPASRRLKNSDYTAILSFAVDEKGTLYLADVIRDKLDVEPRTNLAMSIAEKRQTHTIHYETIGFQDTDSFIIDRKSREGNWYIQIEKMKAGYTSKEDRIKGLQPLYERADIRWPKEYWYYSKYEGKKIEMVEVLRDEMLMFPKAEHDDLLDAHSQLLQTSLYKPSKVNPTDDDEDQFMWWRKQALNAQAKNIPHPRLGQFSAKSGRKRIPASVAWR